jgi:hypothetical protein
MMHNLARVQREAPDVADLIAEGTISLAAGLAELDERERNKRNTIESGRRSAERIATSFAADAIAILSAMELGEVIELDAGQQAQIKQTLELLSKEGPAHADAQQRSADAVWEAKLEAERSKVALLERSLDDLRRRLDAEAEERRRLTAILADQRTDSPARRRWWWRR